jgi:hypothetical protein
MQNEADDKLNVTGVAVIDPVGDPAEYVPYAVPLDGVRETRRHGQCKLYL